jgi:hypothetical protein
MDIKSIAVLGYKLGFSPDDKRYIMSHLARFWAEQGITVQIIRGIRNTVQADLVINHVDLTVTPDEYIAFMDNFKYKVNFNVINISKKLYSNNLLTKNDNYKGMVFIKTDANCGGKIDYLISQMEKYGRPVFNRDKQSNWKSKFFMNSYNYRLLNSIDEVPEGVWDNSNLIVEKFMPEKADNNYFQVRYWYFMGNREFNIGVQADKPVVKGPNIKKRFFIDHIPDELREIRSKFGFEYGRFDYSIVDGKVNIFDMNRTPTIGNSMQELFGSRYPSELANGLHSILDNYQTRN